MNQEHDPLSVPMLFCRVAWMERYQGLGSGDKMSGGGKYVEEHKFGSEMLNFLDADGSVYGYVQPPTQSKAWDKGRINLGNLGGGRDAASISGVLVVWVATRPDTGGGYIVGWYKNATVFGSRQMAPSHLGRSFNGEPIGHYVTARYADATLLSPDARNFQIPQRVRGGMGQSNVWYANDPSHHSSFRSEVLKFIELGPSPIQSDTDTARQYDPAVRRLVEGNAIDTTTIHFERLGYRVTSVERDNLGWDLFARRGKLEFRLEVKGLAGNQRVVELTPNEYRAMGEHRDSYRVCIVSDALGERRLSVFWFSLETNRWENDEREDLEIQPLTGARLSVR